MVKVPLDGVVVVGVGVIPRTELAEPDTGPALLFVGNFIFVYLSVAGSLQRQQVRGRPRGHHGPLNGRLTQAPRGDGLPVALLVFHIALQRHLRAVRRILGQHLAQLHRLVDPSYSRTRQSRIMSSTSWRTLVSTPTLSRQFTATSLLS